MIEYALVVVLIAIVLVFLFLNTGVKSGISGQKQNRQCTEFKLIEQFNLGRCLPRLSFLKHYENKISKKQSERKRSDNHRDSPYDDFSFGLIFRNSWNCQGWWLKNQLNNAARVAVRVAIVTPGLALSPQQPVHLPRRTRLYSQAVTRSRTWRSIMIPALVLDWLLG